MSGEPPSALQELDPGRYQDSWLTDKCLVEKVQESYGLINVAAFPYDERFAGKLLV